ncbi:sigma-70 family RNA polymerase sigma factor (plasmid) [Agrobacterium tumefaciens]|uniref:sigma-70 family RNA polymerase sigma factor n=1 Tax=Agrobacterium tumefaciens TaxID=358 RepID=UPI001573374F|nr:sigma-70 family RNA polymerase sigma factor [Agrobacterium tumefaciens]NSZ66119.1 sigma-70 family RNA polymerase sigma factor [Agrobacterium tumefaciens]NTA72490.1 sigma-70 family RNA polymerase sigma factor [Agrobacterium tumefaciens]WIE41732.1 sigma-70 family RNA polymerase sigma factor [Agrobacterium tumefaciens]
MKDADLYLQLFISHRSEFITYATTIVGDRARGEDVVQEAFLRLRSLTPDRNLDEPIGYLRRVVRNLAIDLVRRSSVEKKRTADGIDYESLAEDRPRQDKIIEDRDDLRIVIDAMAELPDRTRLALEMHRFDGMKLKEIAAELGISVALAHSLVYEGINHCRKRLFGKN